MMKIWRCFMEPRVRNINDLMEELNKNRTTKPQ